MKIEQTQSKNPYSKNFFDWSNNSNSKNGNSKNNLWENENFLNYYNQIHDIITNLNQNDKVFLINILFSITILFCLISLISIYFSDFFILYLNLEHRYPWLQRFLKIRKKFQQTSFIWNSLIITILLIVLILVNFLALTESIF